MRTILPVVGLLLAGVAGLAAAADQPKDSNAKPGVYEAGVMHAQGTVEDIDYNNRTDRKSVV